MNDTWWIKPEQLNPEQKKVIKLPLEGSHLVLGPPGSGKTNLLLLRANYLARSGFSDILIVVFTRTLQEFMSTGASQYAFSNSKIKTSTRWQYDLLREFGVSPGTDDDGDFEDNRLALNEQIKGLISEKSLAGIYDAILLDEAQDYLPSEVDIFSTLGKRLFAVADSRQKIYKGDSPLKLLKSKVGSVHQLKYHYRNGLKICQLADALAKDATPLELMVPTSNYDETSKPSKVEVFCLDSIEEQAQAIITHVQTQIKAYPDEMIGVACPRHEELNHVWHIISSSSIANLCTFQSSHANYLSFSPGKPICISTLHSFKGLEVRALHIAGAEHLKKFSNQRNMAYVAVTRAKTSLSIYHTDDIPGYFESAIGTLGPLPDPPELEDLFGEED